MGRSSDRTRAARCVVGCLAIALVFTACSATRSPFSRAALDAASTLSAAATTLEFAQAGRLSREYAQGSFVGYRDQLSGVANDLPRLAGAPDTATVVRLVGLVDAADRVVRAPCLDAGCDWQAQLVALVDAKEALLEAGE